MLSPPNNLKLAVKGIQNQQRNKNDVQTNNKKLEIPIFRSEIQAHTISNGVS